MKGMEGNADSNRDNQITAAELHEYVEQNVVRQSGVVRCQNCRVMRPRTRTFQ